MEGEWPAQPVNVEEKSCGIGAPSHSSELLNALVGRLDQLIQALDKQNQMLLVMLDANQQMLEELLGSDDSEEPKRDLAGRPLT